MMSAELPDKTGVRYPMLEARGLNKYYSAILAGLLEASGGTVHLDGVNVRDDLLAYKARIGYVPEEAVLYTYLTGPEYLSLVGHLRGLPTSRIEARIDAFMSLFNLRDDVQSPLSAYSKGMRQKIL